MNNALAVIGSEQFDTIERIAKSMVASGYFSDTKQVAQAVVKIMAGQEMGFGPFASMTGIHVVQGKPSPGSNLMAAAVKDHPSYDFRVTELNDKQVSIAFYENGQQIGVSSFSVQDAQRAGTQNMGKFPRNMLYARAMSNGVKWYCPNVFGGAPVYTPDELGAAVDDDGNVIEGEVVPASNGQAPPPHEGYRDPLLVNQKPEPVAELTEPPVSSVDEMRAQLQANQHPALGAVAAAAYDAGLYNHIKHALNALCQNPLIAENVESGKMKCEPEQRVSNAGALQLFDWLIERKQQAEAADEPLFPAEADNPGAFDVED